LAGCAEFALLLRCCRWNFAASSGVRPEAPAELDWPHFVRLAQFHRVQGLAWNALAESAASADAADALSADARSIAATNLAIVRESAGLAEAFARAGIPLCFLKGLTVAALAYRAPMLKMGWDIDLLIAEADVGKAAAELARRAYRCIIPELATDLLKWHARRKESVWSRPEEHLHVELHTRLADNRWLIPSVGIDSPSREVRILGDISLPTLAPDELFAYLCVHGASSLWFRLKWITDLAALLAGCTPPEIERLYRRSQELGAARAADQAMLLADSLYGSLVGSDLGPRLRRDRSSRRLAREALHQLTSEPGEPTSAPLGTWRIHWTQLLLKPDLGFKINETFRQISVAIA